ncbi:MAG: tRNA glutamyl-Q(34) synthetase GluQRS [Rudaea sp.]
MTYRGRFAPSPTGALHFGSLVAAVASWVRARAQAGTWIVRMEDLDPPREVPGAAADILASLAAFGMESDEPVLYQNTCKDAYRAAFEKLHESGEVFPCWCSRANLEDSSCIHRGACVVVADTAREPAWRLRAPDAVVEFADASFGWQTQNLRETAGDFVIRRADGGYSYQLAVVVDDAAQGINEVVRGADLLDSTARQIHLQRLLGLMTPRYLHLPLALDADGRKLSKQDRARTVERDDPLPALRATLAFLGQRVAQASTPAKLLARAAADFDLAALRAAARSATCTIR